MTGTGPAASEEGEVALALEIHHRDTCVVVRPAGDVDLSTAPVLRRALSATIDGGHPLVVLDLAGVPFLDCVGIGVLVASMKRARAAGGDLVLASPARLAVHLLQVLGLVGRFVVTTTVDEAVARGQRGPDRSHPVG